MSGLRLSSTLTCALLAVVTTTAYLSPSVAQACGCFSPPEPVDLTDQYAINQQSEQIIFEVNKDEGTVSAHVMIAYAGEPEQFAWLLPVPNIVDVEISSAPLFAMVADSTNPSVSVSNESLCPSSAYECRYKNDHCPGDSVAETTAEEEWWDETAAEETSTGASLSESPVEIVYSEIVGDYEVIVFSAEEAGLTVDWLKSNDFIVNDTMAPYMQPYLDAGMMFLAAKLVPGAGADSVKPLKMTYRGDKPMIPLQLTAVAAEPHLPVYAYIFGEDYYEPRDQELIEIDPADITGSFSQTNYSAVMNRSIDEATAENKTGAFITEYAGRIPSFNSNDDSFCCDSWNDCGLEDNGACECPREEWDADDCAPSGIAASVTQYDRLYERYSKATRLVTRLSPEEMSFDPVFVPRTTDPVYERLVLQGTNYSLNNCETDVIDPEQYQEFERESACSAIYCGPGSCVTSGDGTAGCRCFDGMVARSFTDLDGSTSVTCAPQTAPVALDVGLVLPDACAGIECGEGACVDVNGFATCRCNQGATAIPSGDEPPVCVPVGESTPNPGGENLSARLLDLEVCAPTPHQCGERGWLIERETTGVLCDSSTPTPKELIEPESVDCDDSTIAAVPDENEDTSTVSFFDTVIETFTLSEIEPDTTSDETSPPLDLAEVSTPVQDVEPLALNACACNQTGTSPLGYTWLGVFLAAGTVLRRRRETHGPSVS